MRTSVCVHARASARPLRWPGFLRSVSLRSQLWLARAGVASLRAEAGASGSAAGGRSFAGQGGQGRADGGGETRARRGLLGEA